jgi:hypothetical protein
MNFDIATLPEHGTTRGYRSAQNVCARRTQQDILAWHAAEQRVPPGMSQSSERQPADDVSMLLTIILFQTRSLVRVCGVKAENRPSTASLFFKIFFCEIRGAVAVAANDRAKWQFREPGLA